MSCGRFFGNDSIVAQIAMKHFQSHLIAPLPTIGLGISQLFAVFCGRIGELEREREPDCRKTFSDVLRSVFMRRVLSEGESRRGLVISWRGFIYREFVFLVAADNEFRELIQWHWISAFLIKKFCFFHCTKLRLFELWKSLRKNNGNGRAPKHSTGEILHYWLEKRRRNVFMCTTNCTILFFSLFPFQRLSNLFLRNAIEFREVFCVFFHFPSISFFYSLCAVIKLDNQQINFFRCLMFQLAAIAANSQTRREVGKSRASQIKSQ